MARNIKNEDALIYGIDRNSYGGYIDGVAVEVTIYPPNLSQPGTTITKNSSSGSFYPSESIASSHNASVLVPSENSYHQIGNDTSGLLTDCLQGNGSVNTEGSNVGPPLYIKSELEESYCDNIHTPLTGTQNRTKSLPLHTDQIPYQQHTGENQLITTEAAQFAVSQPLLFYSNPDQQKQFYGTLERKVFGNEHLLNVKTRLGGPLSSNTYFDSKLSWFANSLQSVMAENQIEDSLGIRNKSLGRNAIEVTGVKSDVDVSINLKDTKRMRVHQDNSERSIPIDEEFGGKYECNECTYRGQSAAILKIHQRTHSGERPFSCHLCDYKAGQKHNVTKHILVHMNEKPYKCQFCDYKCAQKNNLIVHERRHTGVKPFACTYCEYKTVQKPNLVKHMYLHTNEKPFACEYCDYRCVQKTNLKKHLQKHISDPTKRRDSSPSKIFSCSMCPYKCAYRLSLIKHEQTKHTMALAKMNNCQPEVSLQSQHTEDVSVSRDPSTIKTDISQIILSSRENNSMHAVKVCAPKEKQLK